MPSARSLTHALLRSRIGARFSRYTAASVIAALISGLVFGVMYGPVGASSGVATVCGFLSGIVPKYVLCRRWAWQCQGRSNLSEVFPYVAVSLSGTVFTYYLTEFLEDYVRRVADGGLQVFLMGIAFLVSQGLFFVLKFVAFNFFVFTERQPASS